MTPLLWILAAISTAAVAFFTYRADARRAIPMPWLSTLLRTLAVALVWMLLLAPSLSRSKTEIVKPMLILLQDESTSIPIALKADTGRYREQMLDVVERAKTKYRVVTLGFGSEIQNDSLFNFQEAATNISSALERADQLMVRDYPGAVLLATDGRYNQGANPLFLNLALQSPLYVLALGDSLPQKDIRIGNSYAPRTVRRGSQFEVRADFIAVGCDGYNGSVTLSENGNTLSTQQISASTQQYDRTVSFLVQAGQTGTHHYVLSATAASGERNLANNRKDVFVEVVEEKKNILLLGAAPHPDLGAIREALLGVEAYEITTRTDGQLPPDLQRYNAVILHNLPGADGSILANLKSARKAVWYITGIGTNVQSIVDGPAVISPAAHEEMVQTNGSFSFFNLPPKLNAVTDRLPPLQMPGRILNTDPRSQTLFTEKNTGSGAWLLKSGNPATAMLTGEGIWRWRLYEYRYFKTHENIDECIRQTMAFLTANANEKAFRVELPKYEWNDAEGVSMQAFLLNAANEPVNPVEVKLVILDSANTKREYNFERNGNAYRLQLGLLSGGNYKYTATTTFEGSSLSASGSFVVNTEPLEAMQTGADYPLLYSLSSKYNGQLFTDKNIAALADTLLNNEDVKPRIQQHKEEVPLIEWQWYFLLILVVVTIEWLLRKYWMAM